MTSAGLAPRLGGSPLSDDEAARWAQVFKALADPVRLRLLSLIATAEGGEVCVCDLTVAFDLSQPTISHHLKLLLAAGLVEREKRGVWSYYRSDPAAMAALGSLLVER